MAKRIEYLFPVDTMHGQLDAKQSLEYAQNNNAAYYSPMDKRNRARNYRTNVIAMQDSGTGRNRFAIRTRYAFNMTANSKRAMALMGGAAAIYAAALKSDQATSMRLHYKYCHDNGLIEPSISMRKYFSGAIREMLANYQPRIVINDGGGNHVEIWNPFVEADSTGTINPATLIKFFDQLSLDTAMFTIDGVQGLCANRYDFGHVMNTIWDVLNLDKAEVSGVNLLRCFGRWVLDSSRNYVRVESEPVNGAKYTTTSTAPN